MKILFITPNLPYPPRTGSALLAYNHVKHLARRHSIDLIAYKSRVSNDTGELSRWCHHMELVDRLPRWRILLNRIWGLIAGQPLQVAHSYSKTMAETVNRHLRLGSYDVVLFHLTAMAQFRPPWYQGTTVWSMEDPLVLKNQRLLAWSPWYSHLLVRDRIARLRRYEQQQCSMFDRVLLLNEADVQDYRDTLPKAKLDWVPHGVDIDASYPFEAVQRKAGMIVISGNMYHPPNVDAVEFFCRDIFPLVCKRVPSANLWLVGARPTSAVKKWAEDTRIHVTGFVPDVQLYLSQAMVSVCTVRLKIGTQTKILEALACGTPVVTTPAGNHGIGAVSGEHLYVAETPLEIAEHVISLLNEERWSTLSQNGHRFVIDHFGWEKSTAKLESILNEVCSTAN